MKCTHCASTRSDCSRERPACAACQITNTVCFYAPNQNTPAQASERQAKCAQDTLGSAYKRTDESSKNRVQILADAQIEYALDKKMIVGPENSDEANWTAEKLPSSDLMDALHRFASERFQIKAEESGTNVAFCSYQSEVLLALAMMVQYTLKKNFQKLKDTPRTKRPKKPKKAVAQ